MSMNIKKTIKQLDARMKAVAAERDKLDDLIDNLEGLKESCIRAHDALQDARDALSELV